MNLVRLAEKGKLIIGVIAALGFAISAGLLANEAIKSLAANDLNSANSCSFMIPPFFVPGDEAGLFINESYPMESSSIKYDYYDNGKDRTLTNREKMELESATYVIEDMSANLTKEIYQSTMSSAYNQDYGVDVGFEVGEFDSRTFDGYPGYRIESSYKLGENPMIHQTVYIVLSKYRTFTITYQRADDDDCEALFEESAATIHVK